MQVSWSGVSDGARVGAGTAGPAVVVVNPTGWNTVTAITEWQTFSSAPVSALVQLMSMLTKSVSSTLCALNTTVPVEPSTDQYEPLGLVAAASEARVKVQPFVLSQYGPVTVEAAAAAASKPIHKRSDCAPVATYRCDVTAASVHIGRVVCVVEVAVVIERVEVVEVVDAVVAVDVTVVVVCARVAPAATAIAKAPSAAEDLCRWRMNDIF
jgi:hypothetical protein